MARISTAELRRELERRQGVMHDLVRQRDALTAELQELESMFGGSARGGVSIAGGQRRQALGRPAGAKRRGRPPGTARGPGARRGPRTQNTTSLVEALRTALAGKTMGVSDVADAVQQAGYKTSSANFRTIVNQALLGNPKLFRKVSRGQYTVR